MSTQKFQLVVDGSPYIVKATPFNFNEEKRFKVSYNESDEFVFVYDTSVGTFIALGDDAADLPSTLEDQIGQRLFTMA